MEVKEAVKTAMSYMIDVYSDENPTHVGLEEIVYDYENDIWSVTVGFSRPWDYPPSNAITSISGGRHPKRQYKIIEINDESGKVSGMKIREPVYENGIS